MTESPPPTPPVVRRSMSGAQYTVYKQVFIWLRSSFSREREEHTDWWSIYVHKILSDRYEADLFVVFAANTTGQVHHY